MKRRVGIGDVKKMIAYEYDAAGYLGSASYFDVADQANPKSVTEYRHDDFGRLVRVSSPDAGVIAYAYDAAGNVVEEMRADGSVASYTYDASSRLTSVDYPGTDSDASYAWDDDTVPTMPVDCRTNTAMNPGTQRRTMGRLSKVVEATGTRYFNYDEDGRTVALWEQRTGTNCARVSTWEYDAAGRLTAMRLPTGRQLAYAYDGPNPSTPRTIKASRAGVDCPATACPTGWSCSAGACWMPVASEIHMGSGGLRRWKSSNGVTNMVETMLDGAPRRTFAQGSGLTLERHVASADGMGNPTSITSGYPPHDDALTYTPWFHWLESSTRDHGIYEYTVKDTLLGDRTGLVYGLSPDTIEQSISYAPGSSRMSSYEFDLPDAWSAQGADDQRASFVYAPGGAISTIDWETRPIGGAWAYNSSTVITYDGAERMASWDGNEFLYDSRNLRTRKVDDIGTITDFWYDDSGQLQAELGCDAICDENEPRPLKEYLWLAGRPLAMIVSELDDAGEANDSTTAIYDIHTGLLGEPLAITNSAQDVEYQKIHSPFWEFEFDGSTVSTNLRFPGQYEDFETGLFYNWNRYYWPVVGRYTSAEPLLRTPGGVTLHLSGESVPPFTYAQGSPTAYIDPDGNVAIAVAPVGVAIGVGVLACLAVPSCAEAIRRPFRTLINECAEALNRKNCPPCPPPPPARYDQVPPSRPHYPCPGSHLHVYEMNQNKTTCQCYPTEAKGSPLCE